MGRLLEGKILIRALWQGSGCSLSPLSGGQKLLVGGGTLVGSSRQKGGIQEACWWSKSPGQPQRIMVATSGAALPRWCYHYFFSFGKKAKMRVAQDLVLHRFQSRVVVMIFFFFF